MDITHRRFQSLKSFTKVAVANGLTVKLVSQTSGGTIKYYDAIAPNKTVAGFFTLAPAGWMSVKTGGYICRSFLARVEK